MWDALHVGGWIVFLHLLEALNERKNMKGHSVSVGMWDRMKIKGFMMLRDH